MEKPMVGITYLIEEILHFNLSDQPCLMVWLDEYDEWYPVQISHITNEELIKVDGWSKMRWKYSRTTHEWIPVFHLTSTCNRDLLDLVEVAHHPDEEHPTVSPKGHPFPLYPSGDQE